MNEEKAPSNVETAEERKVPAGGESKEAGSQRPVDERAKGTAHIQESK